MFKKIAVKLAVFLLKRSDLSHGDRALLTSCTLDKLAAIPVSDIISVNEQGTLLVNGKMIDIETTRILRESARSMLQSRAFKLVQDQVVYASFVYSMHTAISIEELLFPKAALWWGQQEYKYLKLLAGLDDHDE